MLHCADETTIWSISSVSIIGGLFERSRFSREILSGTIEPPQQHPTTYEPPGPRDSPHAHFKTLGERSFYLANIILTLTCTIHHTSILATSRILSTASCNLVHQLIVHGGIIDTNKQIRPLLTLVFTPAIRLELGDRNKNKRSFSSLVVEVHGKTYIAGD